MSSKSETGHAVNVANFNELISFVTGYGEAYNPSNEAIALRTLQTVASNGAAALEAIYTAQGPYNNAVAAREVAFDPLSKLVTRVMNMLKVSGVSEEVYNSVNTVARKIKGQRATPKTTAPENGGEGDETTEVKTRSTSQMSYDSREENFAKFIQLLSAIPEYAPNEVELQVATLTTLSTNLQAKNSAVISAEVPLSNARIERNNVLYAPTTGLVETAGKVKTYVKAIFGATSPQYKQISKLKFVQR
ncbi:hypothetical protein [uncultured Draconibacterium sp.]|uniref:hypothetical protein n=1 Tax=uncultured Draconibacterium sp. TaxID=1573823 RepID=UPI002AA8002E|nr:hypothetical protein [uncultured Draconibacterium sp.]